MSKILNFPNTQSGDIGDEPPRPRLVHPRNVLHGLYGLWASRVISQDAFFLGAQVCHKMMTNGVSQVTLVGEDAQNHVVRLRGAIYSGPIATSLHTYIAALQDLHFRGGLLNDMIEPKEFGPETARRHFTLSPELTAGRHWSFKTPIYYRIVPLDKAEFFECANRLATGSLVGKVPLDIVEG